MWQTNIIIDFKFEIKPQDINDIFTWNHQLGMNKSKTSIKSGKSNQSRRRGNQQRNQNQRSDYHVPYESNDSDYQTEELLTYDWSKVITIYSRKQEELEVHTAEIDTDHMKTETKGPRGRPLQTWDFIFSPEKFDNEIGLE